MSNELDKVVNRQFHSFSILYHGVQQRMTKEGWAVYTALHSFAGKNDECFPSVASLSKRSKYSEPVVREALNQLVEGEYLIIQERRKSDGGRSSNLYILTDVTLLLDRDLTDTPLKETTPPPCRKQHHPPAENNTTPLQKTAG